MLQHRIGRVSDVLICVIAHETFSSSAYSSLLPTYIWLVPSLPEIYNKAVSLHGLSSQSSSISINKAFTSTRDSFTKRPLNPQYLQAFPSSKMQPKTMLSVLSIAIAASARPSPQTSTSSCTANQQEGCCSSIAANGTGLGCIFSSTVHELPAT